MNIQRLRITAETWGIKARSWFTSLFAGLTVAVVAFGGYVLIAPAKTIAPNSDLLNGLPSVTWVSQFDGFVIIAAGLLMAFIAFR